MTPKAAPDPAVSLADWMALPVTGAEQDGSFVFDRAIAYESYAANAGRWENAVDDLDGEPLHPMLAMIQTDGPWWVAE
jgi:hypothetical protein